MTRFPLSAVWLVPQRYLCSSSFVLVVPCLGLSNPLVQGLHVDYSPPVEMLGYEVVPWADPFDLAGLSLSKGQAWHPRTRVLEVRGLGQGEGGDTGLLSLQP